MWLQSFKFYLAQTLLECGLSSFILPQSADYISGVDAQFIYPPRQPFLQKLSTQQVTLYYSM